MLELPIGTPYVTSCTLQGLATFMLELSIGESGVHEYFSLRRVPQCQSVVKCTGFLLANTVLALYARLCAQCVNLHNEMPRIEYHPPRFESWTIKPYLNSGIVQTSANVDSAALH